MIPPEIDLHPAAVTEAHNAGEPRHAGEDILQIEIQGGAATSRNLAGSVGMNFVEGPAVKLEEETKVTKC
jgi:hypothetical protein